MTIAWGLFFGGIYMAMTRYLRGALWVLLGVVSQRVVAYLGLALWLLPFWAGWFDPHRKPIE